MHVMEPRPWKHRMVLRICLDHLRTHFEPIKVFRRGRIVDDFVYDFERQPGEERKELRHEIQNFVETLRGSGWTSESRDEKAHVFFETCQLTSSHRS